MWFHPDFSKLTPWDTPCLSWVGADLQHETPRLCFALQPRCVCVCVCLSRICVREWWWRQTICLAESGCAWYTLCFGVTALQMFWLFLALLCFWFPLICLEMEGLHPINYGTFEEVLVKSLCFAPSVKLSVPFHLCWDQSNTDLQYEARGKRSLRVLDFFRHELEIKSMTRCWIFH